MENNHKRICVNHLLSILDSTHNKIHKTSYRKANESYDLNVPIL